MQLPQPFFWELRPQSSRYDLKNLWKIVNSCANDFDNFISCFYIIISLENWFDSLKLLENFSTLFGNSIGNIYGNCLENSFGNILGIFGNRFDRLIFCSTITFAIVIANPSAISLKISSTFVLKLASELLRQFLLKLLRKTEGSFVSN